MKIHRFIGDFNPDDKVSKLRPERRGIRLGSLKLRDREILNQLRSVLKLKVGEKIILCDGKMNEGIAEIKAFGKDYIEVEIKEISINQNEPGRHSVLCCSILKRENFELVVQKATEIGIKEIVPIITERTIKLNIRQDRLEKIIREAAEQSGRGILPILHDLISFEKSVAGMVRGNTNLFFDISGIDLPHVKPNTYNLKPVSVWIGPEGGWTPQELETARIAGFEVVNLGNTTLRAETAAIIGSYLVINNF